MIIMLNNYRQGFRSHLPAIVNHPFVLLLLTLLLFMVSTPYWVYSLDPTAALPDAGIWIMILIALLVFILLLLLSWRLLNSSWNRLGLPPFQHMVPHFKQLSLWQQFVLYWASFALLLLAATGCLLAIF